MIAIDDFGLRLVRSRTTQTSHELLGEHYEPTTSLMSNFDFVGWDAALPNNLMAAATLNRLRGGA